MQNTYGQCRCCLVSGYHKNMRDIEEDNHREAYIDMFSDCFNLFLSTNIDLTSLICKSCIEELHRANRFKTMVIQNEQKLLAMSSNKHVIYINLPQPIETEAVLKVESVKSEPLSDNEQMEIDNVSDFCFNSDDNEQEKDKEGESKLLARCQNITQLPTRDMLYTNGCAGYVKHLDLLKGKLISFKMISNLIDEAEREYSGKKIYITEKTAQILNTSIILENSNVTPFKSRHRTGFPCFYCRSVFEDLPNLRNHQATSHSKADIKKSLSSYGAECLVVYVDVTDLKCTICNKNMPNLNELKTHLTRIHKKLFRADYTDRVIPFSLIQDGENKFKCQICGFPFETFGSIERHMNVHFRNYVCKECGTGFVTKYRLKVHTKSMHVGGVYPCEICNKVFTTQQKHKNHVDAVHKLVKRFKCPHCSERFSEYFKRQKHIVEVHDGPPLQYKCNVCDKSFDRRYTLSRHMKRDHLEERDFECQLCAYKCFTKNELRVHMVKHNGERIFECSVCHKSYARKKTLREHMRIHNNDRRFACAVCGQAFVQKCSLKGHIKTHHVDYHVPM